MVLEELFIMLPTLFENVNNNKRYKNASFEKNKN